MFKAGDKVRVTGNGDGVKTVKHFYEIGDEVTVTNSHMFDTDSLCTSSTSMGQFVNNEHLELIQ